MSDRRRRSWRHLSPTLPIKGRVKKDCHPREGGGPIRSAASNGASGPRTRFALRGDRFALPLGARCEADSERPRIKSGAARFCLRVAAKAGTALFCFSPHRRACPGDPDCVDARHKVGTAGEIMGSNPHPVRLRRTTLPTRGRERKLSPPTPCFALRGDRFALPLGARCEADSEGPRIKSGAARFCLRPHPRATRGLALRHSLRAFAAQIAPPARFVPAGRASPPRGGGRKGA